MRERIIEISKQEGLSHIGSCISMAEVLEYVYENKEEGDLVILDAGHAHLAHLVAKEKYEDKIIKLPLHDIHCNLEDGCDVQTGSLGLGVTVALGRAMADRGKDVHCVLSDGGCAEGSVWEALRIKHDYQVNNLKLYVNANGWSALGEVDVPTLERRLKEFDPDILVFKTNSDFEHKGLDAHYKTL